MSAQRSSSSRPLPAISNLSRPYWDGLRERRLTMPKCNACEEVWYPPTPICPSCWSDDFAWAELSGRGTVNSWVRFHQSYFRDDPFGVPYNAAEVTLDEGPRLLTNIVGDGEPEVGMAVEIVYTDVTDDVTVAHFRKVDA